MLLEETPAVLSLGNLCEDHGFSDHWTSGQKPHLTKKEQENWLQYIKLCAIRSLWFVYKFLSNAHTYIIIFITVFRIWFDVNRYTESPVPERSGSTSEELRGNPLHKPTEEVQSDLLHDLPDWLQDFRETLFIERSPSEPRGNPEPGYRDTSSSSHELPMESRAKVEPGSGKRLLAEDVLIQSCTERENFGVSITADHKALGEGCESRHHHRNAVVVQDLATIQSYPCKTKTCPERKILVI